MAAPVQWLLIVISLFGFWWLWPVASSTLDEPVEDLVPTWVITLTLQPGAIIDENNISGVPSQLVAWNDRQSRYISTPTMLRLFQPTKTYSLNPPNAVLSIGDKFAVVEILGCTGDQNHLMFKYQNIGVLQSAVQAASFSPSVAFTLTLDGRDLPRRRP